MLVDSVTNLPATFLSFILSQVILFLHLINNLNYPVNLFLLVMSFAPSENINLATQTWPCTWQSSKRTYVAYPP